MGFNEVLSAVLPFLVLLAFAIIIYAGFTKQKIGDAWRQLISKLKNDG